MKVTWWWHKKLPPRQGAVVLGVILGAFGLGGLITGIVLWASGVGSAVAVSALLGCGLLFLAFALTSSVYAWKMYHSNDADTPSKWSRLPADMRMGIVIGSMGLGLAIAIGLALVVLGLTGNLG